MRLFFLFCLFFLGACASKTIRSYKDIQIPVSINEDSSKLLLPDELFYDKEQTLYALNRAYSGRKYLPADQFTVLNWNIQSIEGPITVRQLCEKLDFFMDSVSDNHLSANFDGRSCYQRPSSRRSSVGKNSYIINSEIPWNVKFSSKRNATALIVSITSFPNRSNPVWSGFLESVKNHLPKAQLVILDLRGNGGGDDSMGWELATLFAGGALKQPYSKQWTSETPESYQLFVNSAEYWMRLVERDGRPRPEYLVQFKKEYSEKRDALLMKQVPEKKFAEETEGRDFVLANSIQKPIYILIDADCASSCESSTDFFEYNALVKTVGENTAGFVHFGNNGSIILKNSGIQLQMAISYNSYKDGRFIEKVGIEPKIKVPSGKDAMDFAWADFFISTKAKRKIWP